ncbi:winged helix-turn-helix domain-containing protein [Natronorubrum sp. FCH18a]|uniref:winged helix-turn-helix domain-containing protein n=1 Tax=Natronorubrum sp. FCH18a TaxID=3447018 RepID=UPI003F519C1F
MPEQEPESEGETVEQGERIDNHPIVELLGNRTRVKIFATLQDASSPLNPHDITENADISRNAWYDNYGVLEEYGVIKQAGRHGNSPLYVLGDVETDDQDETDDAGNPELVAALRKASDLAGAQRRENRDTEDGSNE